MTADELSWLSYSAQPWQSFFPARNAITQATANAAVKVRQAQSEEEPLECVVDN